MVLNVFQSNVYDIITAEIKALALFQSLPEATNSGVCIPMSANV